MLGNYIGVAPDGVTPLANNTGVSFFVNTGGSVTGNTIGGTAPGHRNVISGNVGSGVSLGGSTATDNFVTGNYIGVGADGVTPAGNTSTGIFVSDAQGNTFDANLIGFSEVGIALQHSGTRNRILGNSIRSNTFLGIDLGWDGVTLNDNGDTDTGANNRQNFPVLATPRTRRAPRRASTSTSARLRQAATPSSSSPARRAIAGGYGEGERLVGSTTLAQPGTNGVLLNELVPAGQAITATATDSIGNTSEFSACVAVANATVVTNTNDSGAGSLRDGHPRRQRRSGNPDDLFNIPGVTAATPAVIDISSAPLPTISSR